MKKNQIEIISKHLDETLTPQLLEEIVDKKITFENKITNFYNGDYYFVKYDPCSKEQRKKPVKEKKETPLEIINILSPFSENSFEIDKLDYIKVREDYKIYRHHEKKRNIKASFSILSILAASVGGVGLLHALSEKDVPLAISSVFNIVTGFYTGGIFYDQMRALDNAKFEGLNNSDKSYEEYEKLLKCAKSADKFIQAHYTTHLMKKTLLNKK